jgi:hypothetical protein
MRANPKVAAGLRRKVAHDRGFQIQALCHQLGVLSLFPGFNRSNQGPTARRSAEQFLELCRVVGVEPTGELVYVEHVGREPLRAHPNLELRIAV